MRTQAADFATVRVGSLWRQACRLQTQKRSRHGCHYSYALPIIHQANYFARLLELREQLAGSFFSAKQSDVWPNIG